MSFTFTKMFFKVFRHPRYRVAYALVFICRRLDVLDLIWLASTLATHDQMHNKLDEKGKDMQEYLGTVAGPLVISFFFLIVEWVIKALCYGWFATLTRVEERIRLVLLIPVALYFFLEASKGWEKLPLFDMASVQRGLVALRSTQVFLVVPFFPELAQVYHALDLCLRYGVPDGRLDEYRDLRFRCDRHGIIWESSRAEARPGLRLYRHRSGMPMPRVYGSYWSATRVKFSTITKSMNTLFIAATSQTTGSRRAMRCGPDLDPSLWFANRLFWMAYILLVRFLFLNVCTLIYIYKYESTSPDQPWIAMDQVEEFLGGVAALRPVRRWKD